MRARDVFLLMKCGYFKVLGFAADCILQQGSRKDTPGNSTSFEFPNC